MRRRKFIHLSTLSAMYLQSSIVFSGCGRSNKRAESSLNAVTIDEKIATITDLQKRNYKLHNDVTASIDFLLYETPTGDFFKRFQNNELKLQPNLAEIYFPQNKLWQNYKDAHSLSYEHLTSQLTKLKAGMRIYEYEQTQQKQNGIEKVSVLDITESSPAIDSTVVTFLQTVEDFKNLKFGAVAIDGLTLSIKLVYVVLEQVKNSTAGQYMLELVFKTLESLLKTIEHKAVENLNFSTQQDIILSISKLAITIISVQALSTLSTYSTQNRNFQRTEIDTDTNMGTQTLIQNLALQSQLIATLTAIINTILTQVLSATTTLAANVTDPNYELTNEDQALIDSLKPLSAALALLGLILKALLSFYQNNIPSAQQSGALQGDAQDYTVLFGNPISPYDVTFSQFTSQNYTTLFETNPLLGELLSELGVLNPNFSVSNDPDASQTTAQSESEAYTFASLVASPSYTIATDTTTQASDFATHLADLAYEFVMKIEDDTYTFAMKGMEYGYLFASKGEEVGLMADRILWMAVQIGVMADRIGEMADRIVYTEQLIVYTEMLILDFGILIYGSMKQVSNFALMAMAIIFDREWYTQSDDPVLNVISDMTTRMLRNMQDYELQVLENQTKLRETTVKALDWIQGEY